MNQYKYKIYNLDCANCANELERSLNKIKIIQNVSVNFMTQKLTFECQEENLEEAIENIKKVIKQTEPDVTLKEG